MKINIEESVRKPLSEIRMSSVTVFCDGGNILPDRIEVIWRDPGNRPPFSYPPQRAFDRIWKDVYRIQSHTTQVDGQTVFDAFLKYEKTVDGTVIPEQFVPEEIKWSDKKVE